MDSEYRRWAREQDKKNARLKAEADLLDAVERADPATLPKSVYDALIQYREVQK